VLDPNLQITFSSENNFAKQKESVMRNKNKLKTLLGLSAVALALSSTVACSKSKEQGSDPKEVASGIVSGHRVSRQDELSHSVVALVSESSRGQALCSGTLLANDLVLTAAHCVEDNPDRLVVVFGSQVKAAKQENMREVDGYEQNPRWHQPTADGRGDLAIVHFQGDLPAGFKPVRLATKESVLEAGAVVRMLGYGVTNGSTHAGAGVLRETETTILKMHSPTEVVVDGTKTSVCFGDSGGPAFVKQGSNYVQWGVASSVTSSDCNEAAIHTSVISYRKWIKAAGTELRKKAK
jgi:V8-like Glu-specific endopeptidase